MTQLKTAQDFMPKVEQSEGWMKDLIIAEQREYIHYLQRLVVKAGRQLPTDTSTRKKYFEEFIHREKINKERLVSSF